MAGIRILISSIDVRSPEILLPFGLLQSLLVQVGKFLIGIMVLKTSWIAYESDSYIVYVIPKISDSYNLQPVHLR